MLQPRASRRAHVRVLERGRNSGTRCVQRRREPTQNARAKRDTQRERDGSEVGCEERRVRDLRERNDDSPIGREAECPTERGQHDAFREQLANHSRARCAERESDGDLLPASDGRADDQRRNVGADDEEQECRQCSQRTRKTRDAGYCAGTPSAPPPAAAQPRSRATSASYTSLAVREAAVRAGAI